MGCRRSVIRACGDDRWQDGIQEGYQDSVGLLEAGLFFLRGTLSIHACMMCLLVKIEPTGLATNRPDQHKGLTDQELNLFALHGFKMARPSSKRN